MVFDNKKSTIIFLIILIIITISLRFLWLNNTLLEGDMARDIEISKNIINGKFMIQGIAGGIYEGGQQTFGPLMYYLIAALLIIKNNPLSPVFFIALINSIAVIITYFFCKRFFNQKIAIFASLLYSINPWVLYYSNMFWNPTFLPLLAILFFYSLFIFIIEKKDYGIVLCAFIIAITLHFHLTILFFIPSVFFALLLFRRDTKFKYYGYSLISFLVPLIPYLYTVIKNKSNILGPILFGTIRETSPYIQNIIEAIGIPVMISTNYLGKYIYGSSFIFIHKSLYYFNFFITGIMLILFLLSLIYITFLLTKKPYITENKKKYYLISLLLIFPILAHIIRFSNISPHYYIILYPIQFIFYGIILDFMITKFINIKKILIAGFLIILLSNAGGYILMQNYITNNGATSGGVLSTPYSAKIDALNYLTDKSKTDQINLAFFKSGKSFIYWFTLKNNNIKYTIINNTSELKELKNTYLILDRKSYHRVRLEDHESNYFDNLHNKETIKGIEIYYFE